MQLEKMKMAAEEILSSDFSVIPTESSYMIHDNNSWRSLLETSKAKKEPLGIFFPRTMTAHLKKSSEFLSINFLHEYFGHGNFCENSLPGKAIVGYEKKLESMEKLMLGTDDTSDDFIRHLVAGSLGGEYQKLQNEAKRYAASIWDMYEGFALWTENNLSKELGLYDLFEKKIDNKEIISKEELSLLEQFLEFERKASKYGVFYNAGMPKHYSKRQLSEMISTMYRRELGPEDFVLLYGSQKPHSDIDLFIVSDNINTYYNNWIDIYAFSHKDFERRLGLLDISVTDPIFSGHAIIGNKNKLEDYKNQTQSRGITQEAISFNLQNAEEQAEFSQTVPENGRDYRVASGYAQTCRITADELRKGNKILTLQNIKKKYNI